MLIVVVEDDTIIASGLEYSLQEEGYHVRLATTMQEAIALKDTIKADLWLLDLSLPDGSGYEICRKLKQEEDVPVIFLTAVDDEVNVVMGLDMGADDYITKPFRLRELMSRIKSVLRRYQKNQEQVFNFKIGSITINTKEAKVMKEGKEIYLTAMEYRLLMNFLNNRGQLLSREQLLEGIWDVSGSFVNDNTLTVYMKRLREKLEENPGDPKYFITVRGLGYKLMVEEEVC